VPRNSTLEWTRAFEFDRTRDWKSSYRDTTPLERSGECVIRTQEPECMLVCPSLAYTHIHEQQQEGKGHEDQRDPCATRKDTDPRAA
jgi:hypothetical protein